MERNKLATSLRDQGKIDEARELLRANATYLDENAAKFQSNELKEYGTLNRASATNFDGPACNRERKQMLEPSARGARFKVVLFVPRHASGETT